MTDRDDQERGSPMNPDLTRREFVKTSAFVGGAAAMAGTVPWAVGRANGSARDDELRKAAAAEYPLNLPEHTIYSVCLNCHTACNVKAKIQDGIVVKVDGNPYSPMNLAPHLDEATPIADAAAIDGKLCPKGQAAVQVLYDPYRLRKVLKRKPGTGRGEGKWVTIEWDQFIEEVVRGGDLFGEGNVDGFEAIYKLRDAALAKEMAADVAAVAKGDLTVQRFKVRHRDNLDVLIDPEHPDLGPVNNQFVFLGGRVEHGRKELAKRFTYGGLGSTNFYLHTTICEQSHHIAYNEMTMDLGAGKGKSHMKPDFLASEFVIFFGTGAFEANFGPTPMTEMVTDSLVRRNFRYAVIDPRLSKTAAKAWKWVPIKPGTDASLALGMIRWILDNDRFDRAYLEAPSNAAAKAQGEVTSTDATHLVRTDTNLFLTPEEAGLERPVDEDGKALKHVFVVMTDDGPALHTEAAAGRLEGSFRVKGIAVKPVLQLLKERAQEMTLAEYAAAAGVSEADIITLADEFTSHGKKAAAELYRGPVQHTNGYYNAQAIITLNVLIGNVNHRGGLTTGGSHWHEDGSKPGAPFPKAVIKSAKGALKAFGIHLNREKATYEKSTIFDGYPAQRPWYPFTAELYQNVIPSAAAGYPYPIKILFLVKGTPVFASPAGHKQIDMLRDTSKIPLFIACDVVVGETSMYADYIIPDLTFMERWGAPHITPAILTTTSKTRQPVAAPLTEIVTVDGEEMPVSMDAFLISVGKALGLPGFGPDALGKGFPYDRPEQYYLAMFANLAFGDKEDGSQTLPPADEDEMRIFRAARSHLPPPVYDEEVWRAAVPSELWGSVVSLLNRGGRFKAASSAYKGDWIAKQWHGSWHLYVERVAKAKNSMTGARFDGLPRVEAIADALGQEVVDEGYDLTLITYKEIIGGQSRTHAAPWLQTAVMKENFILINRVDAEERGLADGDRARVVSASLPDASVNLGDGRVYEVAGRVKVVEGIMPGTVAVSWSYGNWAYGSNDVEVDGQVVPGDPRRSTGLVPNPAMRVDDALRDVCLTDPIGGSASFFDTRVRIEKL